MRWSENETYKFVNLYLKHEHLWNPDDPDYKSKPTRQQAYMDIIKDFRTATGILLTDIECKIKIKNLRSTYNQEVTKIKQRSTPGRVYSSTMKWFTEWHNRFRTLHRTINDANCEAPEFEDDSCQKVWISQHDNVDDEVQVDPFVPHSDDDYLLILKSERNESTEETERDPYKVTKRKYKLSTSSADNSEIFFRNSMVAGDNVREDEFDIYGKYIASQLRKLDVQKAIRVQLEIQGIVSEARLSSLRSKD